MRTLFLITAVLTGLLHTLRAEGGVAFEWQGALAPDQRIEIRNINGNVQVEQASGAQVEVTASIAGTRPDPASMSFDTIWKDDGVMICVIYPGGSCDTGSNVRDSDLTVGFVVRVPEHVAVRPRTVNGSIIARVADNPVDAATVNGRVAITTSGEAQARVVNGAISATLGKPVWTGQREFTAVNGSVEVELAADANAEVRGSIVIGTLATDFPILVHRRLVGSWFDGVLGTGGAGLKLSTVTGSVRLRCSAPLEP